MVKAAVLGGVVGAFLPFEGEFEGEVAVWWRWVCDAIRDLGVGGWFVWLSIGGIVVFGGGVSACG